MEHWKVSHTPEVRHQNAPVGISRNGHTAKAKINYVKLMPRMRNITCQLGSELCSNYALQRAIKTSGNGATCGMPKVALCSLQSATNEFNRKLRNWSHNAPLAPFLPQLSVRSSYSKQYGCPRVCPSSFSPEHQLGGPWSKLGTSALPRYFTESSLIPKARSMLCGPLCL